MVGRAFPDKPKRVKLFCGLIGQPEAMAQARSLLEQRFGEIDCESPQLQFAFTDYYREEMGTGLLRQWLAFKDLRERGFLSLAKHATVALEGTLAGGARRLVNIDPGYVDDAQVVLATAKNYSHRVYIGMGYYAEVTLVYEHKAFKFLEWTYPDYRSPEALRFLLDARTAYVGQLREGSRLGR